MPKTVVFVGDSYQLTALQSMGRDFKENGWTVENCESIEIAKTKKPDLLVVYAYASNHVADFTNWQQHPPTVWLCFSKIDRIPAGTKCLRALILPSRLYAECMQLID